MKKMVMTMGMVALLLATSGCFKHTYTVGSGAPSGRVVYDHWHNHWVFGLVGDKNVPLEEICTSGNATIHEELSFLNGLVAAFIGAIYTPTTVKVRCDDGSQADLDLSAEQVELIVNDERFLLRIEEVLPELLEDVEVALLALEEQQ